MIAALSCLKNRLLLFYNITDGNFRLINIYSHSGLFKRFLKNSYFEVSLNDNLIFIHQPDDTSG